MEDGEGGEDESMQEGPEEGRRPMGRKSENQPSSQEVARAHEDSHPIPLLVRSLCQGMGKERSPQVRRRKERTKGHPHFAMAYGIAQGEQP